MKRREFLFSSLTAAALFSPLLSSRRAHAQSVITPKRLFVWVCSAGYPDEQSFFTNGQENNWQLGEILANCAPVKDTMVVLDGVQIRDSGYNAAGANHARALALNSGPRSRTRFATGTDLPRLSEYA